MYISKTSSRKEKKIRGILRGAIAEYDKALERS